MGRGQSGVHGGLPDAKGGRRFEALLTRQPFQMLNPKSVQTNASHSVSPVGTRLLSARPRKAVYPNVSFHQSVLPG